MMKSSFRIGIDSMLLFIYIIKTEYTVFKKESPSPVEVEPGDLLLLKYGIRKKNQSTTGKEGQEGGSSRQIREQGKSTYGKESVPKLSFLFLVSVSNSFFFTFTYVILM